MDALLLASLEHERYKGLVRILSQLHSLELEHSWGLGMDAVLLALTRTRTLLGMDALPIALTRMRTLIWFGPGDSPTCTR